jgi:hypothetical protein
MAFFENLIAVFLKGEWLQFIKSSFYEMVRMQESFAGTRGSGFSLTTLFDESAIQKKLLQPEF